ncbi:hypothetical protein R84B8_02189 [Treponema sp. R8-4-B8]
MIYNKNKRKFGEGIWWKSSKYKKTQKNNTPDIESNISVFITPAIRIVSKAEKEAWERAALEIGCKRSASESGVSEFITSDVRIVSKAEKEAWEKVALEVKRNAIVENIVSKLIPLIEEALKKVEGLRT